MRRRTFLTLVAAVVALSAVNLVFLVAAPLKRPTVVLDDLSECLTPLFAAASCFFTAARGRGRTRQAWGLIGVSAACWGSGQLIWTVQEVLLNLHPADLFPSYPDVGYLSSVPFGLVGLLRLPGVATGAGARLRALLDGLLIGGALLFISWDLVLGPVYAQSGANAFAQVVSLAYPASDIAMVTIIVLTLSRLRVGQRLPLALLGVGVLLNAVADSSFAFLTTVQSYASVNFPDLGWTMGYALIGLAAVRTEAFATQARVDETRLPHWTLLLPYWTIGTAGILAGATEFRVGSLSRVLEWDLLFTITIVVLRQFLFLRETHALSVQVAVKNDDLDLKVRERTHALTESLEELHRTNDERRLLLLRLVTLQESEQQHIADVIHDDMLQSMIAAKMRVFRLRGGSDTSAETTASIGSAIDRAIVRMRSLMSDLRPQILDLGLLASIEQTVSEFNEESGLVVELHNDLTGDPSPLISTTVYRIVREALNNARKHAPGATVGVTLRGGGLDGVGVRISDDGPGFTPQDNGRSPRGHRGLSSMQERAEALDGRLIVKSAVGRGTTIDIWLPPRPAVVSELPAA
jgi:signal transduction histidine kinase